MTTLFEMVGEEGVTRVVAGFYRRVAEDEILAPMYPEDDMAGAEHRLREFLIFRIGGPRRYLAERGHPRLRMRHRPFPIDDAARDRWLTHMGAALDEEGLPEEADAWFRAFFQHAADAMVNR